MPITHGHLGLRRRAHDAAACARSPPSRTTAGSPRSRSASAMQRAAERDGAHPLFELEKGKLTEADFLTQLAADLEPELGHRPELHGFREIYFKALDPNEPMVELMREPARPRLPHGAADQQRPRVGAAVALAAARGRDLRADRRLRLRRHAQARRRDLRADARAPRRPRARRSASSSTTSRSTSRPPASWASARSTTATTSRRSRRSRRRWTAR